MKKFEERGTAKDILSLAKPPGYLTAEGRGKRISEKEYVESCVALLDRAAKKYPGYRVRMNIRNGIPHFSYFQPSLTQLAVEKRINRTLSGIRKDVAGNRAKNATLAKIDRAKKQLEAVLWDE